MSEPYSLGVVGFGYLGRRLVDDLANSQVPPIKTAYVSRRNAAVLGQLIDVTPAYNGLRITPCASPAEEPGLLAQSRLILFTFEAFAPFTPEFFDSIKDHPDRDLFRYIPYPENHDALMDKAEMLRKLKREELSDKLFIIVSNPTDLLAAEFWHALRDRIDPDQVLGLNPETYRVKAYARQIAEHLHTSGFTHVTEQHLRDSIILGEHSPRNQFVLLPEEIEEDGRVAEEVHNRYAELINKTRSDLFESINRKRLEAAEKLEDTLIEAVSQPAIRRMNLLGERGYTPEMFRLLSDLVGAAYNPGDSTVFVSSIAEYLPGAPDEPLSDTVTWVGKPFTLREMRVVPIPNEQFLINGYRLLKHKAGLEQRIQNGIRVARREFPFVPELREFCRGAVSPEKVYVAPAGSKSDDEAVPISAGLAKYFAEVQALGGEAATLDHRLSNVTTLASGLRGLVLGTDYERRLKTALQTRLASERKVIEEEMDGSITEKYKHILALTNTVYGLIMTEPVPRWHEVQSALEDRARTVLDLEALTGYKRSLEGCFGRAPSSSGSLPAEFAQDMQRRVRTGSKKLELEIQFQKARRLSVQDKKSEALREIEKGLLIDPKNEKLRGLMNHIKLAMR